MADLLGDVADRMAGRLAEAILGSGTAMTHSKGRHNHGDCRRAKALRVTLAQAAVLVGLHLGAASGVPATFVLEAELGEEAAFPWQPVHADGASQGLALGVPEGVGSGEVRPPPGGGGVWFGLPIEVAATYDLWFRVRWNGNCSNSMFLLWEGDGEPVDVSSRTMGRWHWVKAATRELEVGSAAFVVHNREDGVWLDQICLQPSGAPPPKGLLPASPAALDPGPLAASATLTVGGCSVGVEALPPTDFLLSHKREPSRPMPPLPVVVVTPGATTPLDVWIRWNRPQASPAECSIGTDAAVSISPEAVLQIHAEQGPLQRRRFHLRAHPSMPRGVSRLWCRLTTVDGLEQVREVLLLRPYRWQVSQPFPLNPGAGIGQGAALDAAVVRAPLDAANGIQWREVEPGHFTPFGLVDLRAAVSRRTAAMAYAHTQIEAETGGVYLLDVTHDDWLQVWINGVLVLSRELAAPSTATRSLVPVTLHQGSNAVVVKCCQLKSYWEFGLVLHPPPDPEMPPGSIWGGLP